MPSPKSRKMAGAVVNDFDAITSQLRDTLKSLEKRVTARTHDLELASEISREVATQLDIDQLLPRLVELTKKRFKLYHAQVYVFDAELNGMLLAAGAGKVGKTLKKRGHIIPIDSPRSLVARTARTRGPVLINNTRGEASFLPNPLLGETRSELAVPMIAGDELMGVLDLQSEATNRFSEDDIYVMTSLAGQVAVSIRNAAAFTELRRTEAQLERIYSQSVDLIGTAGFEGIFNDLNPAWEATLGWSPEELEARPLVEFSHPDDIEATENFIRQVVQGEDVFAFENRIRTKEGGYRWLSWNARPDLQAKLMFFVARDITENKNAAIRQNTAYDLAQRLATVLNPEELLPETVNRLVEAFGYYHAHIYLYEPDEELLVVRYGFGNAGANMLRRGHSIPLSSDRSLVARAARLLKPVVVEDTQLDKAFLPNPLLPDTRSEAAVPLVVGQQTLGVLDAQSIDASHFTPEEVAVLEIVASQLAIALSNSRAIESARLRAEQLKTAAEISVSISRTQDITTLTQTVADQTKERFGLYHAHIYLLDPVSHLMVLAGGAGEAGRRMLARAHTIPFDSPRSVVARAAREGNPMVVGDTRLESTFLPNPLFPKTRAELAVPLVAYGDVLGVLDVQSEKPNRFDQEEQGIFSTLASQVAVALSNTRLLSEAESRAHNMATVAAVSVEISGAKDPVELMQIVADQTKERFGLYHAHIYLLDTDSNLMVLAGGAGEAGRRMLGRGHIIPFDSPRSVVARAGREGKPVVVDDTRAEASFLPNPLLPNTRAELAVPLVAYGKVLGVLDVQSEQPNRFDTEAQGIFSTLASQVAVAYSNTQLLSEAEARARDMATVAQISVEISGAKDATELAQTVADQTKERFGLYHAHIYLLDTDSHLMVLAGGAGEAGRRMLGRGHIIPFDSPRSVVARAGREGKPVVVDDTRAEASFLPNPLLPNTRAELAVPLVAYGEVLGVLDVQSEQPNHFDAEAQGIFSTLASQIAVAYSNTQLLAEAKARARDMATVAQVSIEISGAKDAAELAQTVADQTKERFGLYHAHIYLLDTTNNLMVLAGGAGEAGRRMLGRGHIIPFDSPRSVVARAGREGKPVVVDDTRAEASFLPNPLLPETRSELAVPLVAYGEVLGVLDIQSEQPGRFDEEAQGIFSTLASQVAVAYSNTLLLAEAESRANAMATVAEVSVEISGAKDAVELAQTVADQTKDRFGLYHAHIYLLDTANNLMVLAGGAGEAGRRMLRRGHIIPFDSPRSVVARAGREGKPIVVDDTRAEASFLPNPLLPETRSELAVPLVAYGEVLGVLDVQSEQPNRFDEEQQGIFSTLASQIAVAYSNTQLLAEAKARARDMATVAQVSIEISGAKDATELLQTVADQTQERFGLYHAHIYLLDTDSNLMVLASGAGEAGRRMLGRGHIIPFDSPRSVVARAGREGQPVVVNDTRAEASFLPNPLLPNTRAELAVPLVAYGEVLGVLDVQSDRPNRFDEEEQGIFSTLASQVAVAYSNTQLLSEAESRARDLATIAEVSVQVSGTLDTADLLQNVVDLTKERFDLYHAHIYLLNQENQSLDLAAGAGEPGRVMLRRGHKIPFNSPRSIVANAARSGSAVVVDDTRTAEHFLPNPLLPDTLCEMAVPLKLGDNVLGVLDVQSNRVKSFGAQEQQMMTTLAGQIAVAVSNARLFEETQTALSETAALYSGSRLIVSAEDFAEILDGLVQSTDLNTYDQSRMILFEHEWDILQPATMTVTAVWNVNKEDSSLTGTTYSLDESPLTALLERNAPVMLTSPADSPLIKVLEPEASSVLLLPLIYGERWIGSLMALSKKAITLEDRALRRIEALVGQAAAVIQSLLLLQEARDTAEALRTVDRLKSEFLASMSHELRTPLNSIIGYSELLIDGIGGELDEMSVEDLKGIHSSGQYLLAIINDVLDLAKIEAGRLELAPGMVDLREMAPEVIDASRILLKDKGEIELLCEIAPDSPMLSADPVRIRQVLWNLMSNSIKFTEQGHVRLFGYREGSWYIIGVEDTGIGIAPEHHAIVFDQFRQVDGSTTRRAGGTGLGLAITRQLVQMHKGDMWLESEVGKGSTFFLKLPIGEASAPPTQPYNASHTDEGSNGSNGSNGSQTRNEIEAESAHTPGD
jgi:PAS domain S-box-containing protein